MSEYQWIINTLIGALLGGLSWGLREMWGEIKRLNQALADLRAELPREYMSREDLREMRAEIKESISELRSELAGDVKELKDAIGRIFDRMDRKVDKRSTD